MYTYTLQSERQVIDYYTDDRESYPESDWTFSDASVWAARWKLILHLIKKQEDSTIVDFSEISIYLSANKEEEPVFLGSWTLRSPYKKEYGFEWDWKAEANFLEKHGLFRAGDKELLAIEQAYHQTPKLDENEDVTADLKTSLSQFEEKYKDAIQDYAPEIGILYFFLRDYAKAFDFLALCPMPAIQDLTYSIAFKLSYFGGNANYEYMRKYDALYQERPSW